MRFETRIFPFLSGPVQNGNFDQLSVTFGLDERRREIKVVSARFSQGNTKFLETEEAGKWSSDSNPLQFRCAVAVFPGLHSDARVVREREVRRILP